jgi:peroxiredoxin
MQNLFAALYEWYGMNANLPNLPKGLPVSEDDDATAHLTGLHLPAITLPGTDAQMIDLQHLKGRWVVYIYPMTGRPDVPLPDGWDAIPGARGCTPQACSFRDHYHELKALNTDILGLSAQTTAYQKEARDRLHLPFQLLSDNSLQLKQLLGLPTFNAGGMEFYKRLTLIVEDGRIVQVFYPVLSPDHNVDDVLAWLQGHAQAGTAWDTPSQS